MHTLVRIDGANCSFCFNEALAELKRTAGVLDVHGSFSKPSIDITHDDAVDTETLISIVRNRIHGIAMYANEIRMIPLEPTTTTEPVCNHT